MSDFPALTKYTRFSGCGAKLGPGVLEKALCGLRQPAYPELMATVLVIGMIGYLLDLIVGLIIQRSTAGVLS